MDSPQNHIWGPQLWMILHSSAERIGIPKHGRLPQEEHRLWTGLLSSLQYSLPCPVCKKHYYAYLTAHPITSITKEFIRNWLFVLHRDINARTNKSDTISIENIPEIYEKPFNFSAHFNIVNQEMAKALRLGLSSRNDILRTVRFLEELKRYYDFF
jgi:hypothetical protein